MKIAQRTAKMFAFDFVYCYFEYRRVWGQNLKIMSDLFVVLGLAHALHLVTAVGHVVALEVGNLIGQVDNLPDKILERNIIFGH